MTSLEPKIRWTPLQLLRHRFAANIAALERRYPQLAEALRLLTPKRIYHILPGEDRLLLGVEDELSIQVLPQPLPPAKALELANTLYPKGSCDQALLVLGEDQGWLWNRVYRLPCDYPGVVGFRPPLYFLVKNLEHFWVMLHLQDWETMLADARVQLFAAEDAFEQFRVSLIDHPRSPWPQLSITVDQSLWPAGVNIDTLLSSARDAGVARLANLGRQLHVTYQDFSPEVFAARCKPGASLRVMGMTSRYTTFLQHSMRDWLAAFERMGHQTRLFIESADHETSNSLATAAEIADFKPDLIVAIDHYREEMGAIPDKVPMAMWVQDYMPQVYSPQGAAAQGPRDYVLGFAYEMLRLVHELGYPSDRYLTTSIGIDANRFKPRGADDAQLAGYVCDVCFVTHASMPAEQIVQEQIDRNGTPQGKKLLTTIFEKLRAVYDGGGTLVAPPAMRKIIDQSFIDSQTQSTPKLVQQLADLFYMRVNNALFRHQSLKWLVELGVDLRIYGRGWENNPAFKQFARGVANNQVELSLIYQASRINLQASPVRSLHQRVMEGLASGGFFLMRRGDGDVVGRYYARLREYCQQNGIVTDQQLLDCTDPVIRETLRQTVEIHQCDPFANQYTFMQLLQMMHDSDYLCSAGCVWGRDYDQTSYDSKEELAEKVTYFLANPRERERLTQSMMQPVLERFTYEKISSLLLEMIVADQAASAEKVRLAA